MAFPDGVIVLAGGGGRRLGGADKAALSVGDRTLLQIALAATAGRPTVVVGPPRTLPAGVVAVQEDPPGGGPAAGVVAGLAALQELLGAARRTGRGDAVPAGDPARNDDSVLIAVLAVDMPGVGAGTLARLAAAARSDRDRPTLGAVLRSGGRRQHTIGVFPATSLAARVRDRADWHGVALAALLDPLVGVEVPAEGDEAGDVDTPADLRRWRAARDPSVGGDPAGR